VIKIKLAEAPVIIDGGSRLQTSA